MSPQRREEPMPRAKRPPTILVVDDRDHIVAPEDPKAATARMAARDGHVSGHVGAANIASRSASVQNDSTRL